MELGIAAAGVAALLVAAGIAMVALLIAVRMIRRTLSLVRKVLIVAVLFGLTTAVVTAAVTLALVAQTQNESAPTPPAPHR